jgi:serine/threonine protein kinase
MLTVTKLYIWSVSCTIIELLTGLPPWGEESSVSVVWKIVEGDMYTQIPVDISHELRELLLSCFSRDVETRPTAENLLQHSWITTYVKGVRNTL